MAIGDKSGGNGRRTIQPPGPRNPARDPVWTLTSLDDGTVIQGQYRPQDFAENVGGMWSTTGTVGLDQPVLQFIRGELETITFQAKVWAEHGGDANTQPANIKEMVDKIRNLPRIDRTLKRPHVWTLTWTDEYQADVVVRSVGGIKYDAARPEGLTPSSFRGVLFSMDLARYVQYDAKQLIGAAESLIIYVKEGETYESLALRLYGDPSLGDSLRRRNPDKLVLTSGDRLHLPPKATMRREQSNTPASSVLRSGANQSELLAATLAKRSVRRRTHLLSGDI